MPRPPKVSTDELIAALRAGLNWPTVAALSTAEVAAQLDRPVNIQTVRNRLKHAHDAADAPISGLQPGEQSGWVWWLTDATLYTLEER
jgi:hypothetical protein